MGRAKKELKSVDIWKKKKWHQLIAPKSFNEAIIGETPALESQMVMGREATLSLMSVTGDVKKQNINISFVVDKVVGDKAFTEVKRFETIPAYIKRIVRRGRDRLDETYILYTADRVKISIKPVMITNANISSSLFSKMRKLLAQEMKRKIENLNYRELVGLLVTKKLQSEFIGILSKVYPLKNFEIRKMDVLSFAERTAEVEKKPEPKPEVKPKEESEDEEDFEDLPKKKKAKKETSSDSE